MITDPLTLGVAPHLDVFSLTETGPGARTIRPTTSAAVSGTTTQYEGMTLTISHETNKSRSRRRSVLRLDFSKAMGIVLQQPSEVAPPSAYIVVDRPVDDLAGDTALAAKELLSRILGFLTGNATAAPDHSFASVPKVSEWLRGEP